MHITNGEDNRNKIYHTTAIKWKETINNKSDSIKKFYQTVLKMTTRINRKNGNKNKNKIKIK